MEAEERDDVSRAVALSMQSKVGLNPSLWGPCTWATLHRVAKKQTDTWSVKQRQSFLTALQYVLPCPKCRASLTSFLTDDVAVQEALADLDLVAILYQAHQWVNYKHNRRKIQTEWTLERAAGEEYNQLSSVDTESEAQWAPDAMLMFFFMFCNCPYADDSSVEARMQREQSSVFYRLVTETLPPLGHGGVGALFRSFAEQEWNGALSPSAALVNSTRLVSHWYTRVYRPSITRNPRLTCVVRTLATSCSVLRDDPTLLSLVSYSDVLRYLHSALQ